MMWQLPQHIIAGIMYLIFWNRIKTRILYGDIRVYLLVARKWWWGISLGKFIFLCGYDDRKTIHHELGHSQQSKIFGPLYLIVCGIPSIIRATLSAMFLWPEKRYYSGWPEKQADKLGGVQR